MEPVRSPIDTVHTVFAITTSNKYSIYSSLINTHSSTCYHKYNSKICTVLSVVPSLSLFVPSLSLFFCCIECRPILLTLYWKSVYLQFYIFHSTVFSYCISQHLRNQPEFAIQFRLYYFEISTESFIQDKTKQNISIGLILVLLYTCIFLFFNQKEYYYYLKLRYI